MITYNNGTDAVAISCQVLRPHLSVKNGEILRLSKFFRDRLAHILFNGSGAHVVLERADSPWSSFVLRPHFEV